VRDLALPEGVVLRSDPDLSVASVITPKVEEEVAPVAAPVEGEAAAAPAEGAAAEGAAEKETEE
jgi:hypothetical protein